MSSLESGWATVVARRWRAHRRCRVTCTTRAPHEPVFRLRSLVVDADPPRHGCRTRPRHRGPRRCRRPEEAGTAAVGLPNETADVPRGRKPRSEVWRPNWSAPAVRPRRRRAAADDLRGGTERGCSSSEPSVRNSTRSKSPRAAEPVSAAAAGIGDYGHPSVSGTVFRTGKPRAHAPESQAVSSARPPPWRSPGSGPADVSPWRSIPMGSLVWHPRILFGVNPRLGPVPCT